MEPKYDATKSLAQSGEVCGRPAMERLALSAVITTCASAVDLRFVVHLYNDRRPETCSNVERIQSLYGLILFVVDKTHSVITSARAPTHQIASGAVSPSSSSTAAVTPPPPPWRMERNIDTAPESSSTPPPTAGAATLGAGGRSAGHCPRHSRTALLFIHENELSKENTSSPAFSVITDPACRRRRACGSTGSSSPACMCGSTNSTLKSGTTQREQEQQQQQQQQWRRRRRRRRRFNPRTL